MADIKMKSFESQYFDHGKMETMRFVAVFEKIPTNHREIGGLST